MFHFILFIIACAYFLYRLITDKSPPKGARIDYDAMQKDRDAGVPLKERQRKWKRNEYWTTEPPKKPVEVIPKVVDYERYLRDKEQLGEAYAERRRSYGEYLFIREF